MKKSGMMIVSLTALAMLAGCGGTEGQGEDSMKAEDSMASVEQAATRYCVAQSYASAILTNSSSPFCPNDLSGATTQLSNGHPVHITYDCFPSRPYVKVVSLWNGNYYWMRGDALSPC